MRRQFCGLLLQTRHRAAFLLEEWLICERVLELARGTELSRLWRLHRELRKKFTWKLIGGTKTYLPRTIRFSTQGTSFACALQYGMIPQLSMAGINR